MSDKIRNENNILTALLLSPHYVMPINQGSPNGEDGSMVGKSKDPKGTRITVRISEKDLSDLQMEARRKNITVGAVVRGLIRECLPSQGSSNATG
jgi:hypothetical protein